MDLHTGLQSFKTDFAYDNMCDITVVILKMISLLYEIIYDV